jgi:hypothetical protein
MIIIITKPTRMAWAWALIHHGVGYTPASSRRASL